MKLIKPLLLLVLATGVCYWIINYFDLIKKLDLVFELRNKKHLLWTDFWFIFLPFFWFLIIAVWLASFVGAVKYKNSETGHDVLEYAYITLIYPILDPQGENKHWLFWAFMGLILAGIVGA